jgi:hypothetical protein
LIEPRSSEYAYSDVDHDDRLERPIERDRWMTAVTPSVKEMSVAEFEASFSREELATVRMEELTRTLMGEPNE